MKNYGTGSMLRTVRELISASNFSNKEARRVLLEFAIDETELIMNQECKAERPPHYQSWKALGLAHAIVRGQVEPKTTEAELNDVREVLRSASWNSTHFAYPAASAYSATSASYDVWMAALDGDRTPERTIRTSVSALLGVSLYAYEVNIKKHGYSTARVAECATMDRHEAALRVLLGVK